MRYFPAANVPELGGLPTNSLQVMRFATRSIYFIPSISKDGKHLIYHRAADGEVQLFRLELNTGKSIALTAAHDPDCAWTPWDTDPGQGVLDHRSALNVARDEVLYFAQGQARVVHLETLADRLLFELPPGRKASCEPGMGMDGTPYTMLLRIAVCTTNWGEAPTAKSALSLRSVINVGNSRVHP